MPDDSKPAMQSLNAPAGVDSEAELNWRRYEYIKQRGHSRYTMQAARCENFYFGGDTTNPQGYRGDGQWLQDDVDALDGVRPSYTINEIKPGINSAIGYQIHNRLDISYKPTGGLADMDKAAIRSKVAMQVLSANKYHWLETQMFGDGLIEQRGYVDVRMDFDTNIYGDIRLKLEDNRDVAPDPDAKTYDPRGWGDVCVTRWYTADEIEQFYGKEAREKATQHPDMDGDWGEHDDSGPRNKFGDTSRMAQFLDCYRDGDDGLRRFRIIERQRWVYEMCKVAVYESGDVKPIPNATPEQIQGYVGNGAVIQRRMQRQVRWSVTTRWSTLHSALSPYDRFTIIPYFCYFRRGRTAGKVDDAIDPSQILNKSISSFVHIINTTANSGWISEQNSLVNMKNEDLENEGSKTGLNIIVKAGSKYPEKIKPNPVPEGLDRLIDRAYMAIKNATTPDAMRGTQGQEVSGVAIQSKQFASQQELAMPLDNLTHTRGLVADFITYLISTFYTNYRIFRITEQDPQTGKPVTKDYEVNKWNGERFENDLTEGSYDTVVDSVPMQITFENSQFMQAMEIKKVVPGLPDRTIIKNSSLADKAEIMEAMDAQSKGDPVEESKATLMMAQAALAAAKEAESRANAANIRMTTMFASVQAGKEIAVNPAIAAVADQLAQSAGVEDQNAAPVIDGVAPGTPAGAAIPSNTSPLVPLAPTSPMLGAESGIEGGQEPQPGVM